MLVFLQSYLPICIYILLIILIIIGIILGVKIICLIDRANEVLDDIGGKISSLNGIFSIIDFTTNKVEGFTNRCFNIGSMIVSKMLRKDKKKKKEEEIDDYE